MNKIALMPGLCPGKKRLSGGVVPACHTCGCFSLKPPTIEPAAEFISGVWHCDNWRGHSVNVRPARPLVQSVVLGGVDASIPQKGAA